MSPSDLLDDEQWVKRAIELFGLEEYGVPACFKATRADQEEERSKLKEKADVLMKILRQRLKQHIDMRAGTRKDHWVWKFARKNLAVVAAYMILADHTKSRIACMKEGDSLLSPNQNQNKFKPCMRAPKHKGCYLFYVIVIRECSFAAEKSQVEALMNVCSSTRREPRPRQQHRTSMTCIHQKIAHGRRSVARRDSLRI